MSTRRRSLSGVWSTLPFIFKLVPITAQQILFTVMLSDGVLEDMSLASRILEDNFYSPWPRGLCPWPWPRG